MNKTSNIILGVIALGLLGLGLVEAKKGPAVVTVTKTEIQTIKVPTPVSGGTVTVPAPTVNVTVPASNNAVLGAVTGADLYSPYWNVNSFYQFPLHPRFNAATTTPCSYRANSTTTVEMTTFQISSSTNNANLIVTLATSTNSGASTSPLATWTVLSGNQASLAFYPSNTNVAPVTAQIQGATTTLTLAPLTYLNWTVAGTGVGGSGTLIGGACNYNGIQF